MSKILAFSGSSRKESFNQKLVKISAAGAEKAGAEVKIVSLGDFQMPLFNQDFEAEYGMPEDARLLKTLLAESDGFLIASPEYNGAFSPLLKNAIDWASRSVEGEPPMEIYKNKVAGIMAASPGALGGMRGLVFLRMLLNNLGVMVLPDQLTVPSAFKAFNEDGQLLDQAKQRAIESLGERLHQVCCALP